MGGAAINSNYINRIAKHDGIYEHGIFYCSTMFDGLKTMDKLVSDERDEFVQVWREKLEKWEETKPTSSGSQNLPHSGIKPVKAPTPPKN